VPEHDNRHFRELFPNVFVHDMCVFDDQVPAILCCEVRGDATVPAMPPVVVCADCNSM
jgi:hypothetical protein